MKYLFIDMDGTVSEYNIRGSVILDNWFEPNIFRNAKPVQPVIDKLKQINNKHDVRLFIMSVAPSREASDEKIEWLKEHMPFIKESYFVCEAARKVDYIKELCKDVDESQVYLLDDTHAILEQTEKVGFNAIHTSTFLAREIF